MNGTKKDITADIRTDITIDTRIDTIIDTNTKEAAKELMFAFAYPIMVITMNHTMEGLHHSQMNAAYLMDNTATTQEVAQAIVTM